MYVFCRGQLSTISGVGEREDSDAEETEGRLCQLINSFVYHSKSSTNCKQQLGFSLTITGYMTFVARDVK